MAGRGRGRQASSFTQEQLQVLGCVGKDIPSVPTAPPPTFPQLMTKPANLEISNSLNFQILWKEDFSNYMRHSPYFLAPKMSKSNIQRYSDQYVSILENSKERQKPEIPWNLMPAELRPASQKRKVKSKIVQPKKYKRIETLEQRLKRLEEKEKTDSFVDDKEQKPSDSENEENENELEVEEDDEMDEDNDYGNSYFDNGEAFNEEDDNLDDGPIY